MINDSTNTKQCMIYYITLINCDGYTVLNGKLIVHDGRFVNGFKVDSISWLLANVNIITFLLLPFSITAQWQECTDWYALS
jgi:hypothetical protein